MSSPNRITKPAPKNAPGLRQTMSDLHTWAGLLVGWILYAMFLTGTVSYFRDEISQWMRPELAAQQEVPDSAEVAQRMVGALSSLAPDSPQWSFSPPDERNPVVSAFWRDPKVEGRRGFHSATLDAATGQKLNARARPRTAISSTSSISSSTICPCCGGAGSPASAPCSRWSPSSAA